jgi:hypothetical protein
MATLLNAASNVRKYDTVPAAGAALDAMNYECNSAVKLFP